MAKKPLPTPDELGQLLRYDPDTGKLFWRERTPDMFSDTASRSAAHICANWNSRDAYTEAFTSSSCDGYRQGTVKGRNLLAHRVIWAMVSGQWPSRQVDHINGIRDDNRWGNMRLANDQENAWNMASRGGTSCYKGVHLNERGRWIAQMKVSYQNRYLGSFASEEEAARCYDKAALAEYGDFARLNFPSDMIATLA